MNLHDQKDQHYRISIKAQLMSFYAKLGALLGFKQSTKTHVTDINIKEKRLPIRINYINLDIQI